MFDGPRAVSFLDARRCVYSKPGQGASMLLGDAPPISGEEALADHLTKSKRRLKEIGEPPTVRYIRHTAMGIPVALRLRT